MTESRAPASGYRPDIDGLRAIALLSVVVYHIDATLIPGGFTGVDMFFVISGFLISQHIIGDIERGTFSMAEFYRRRVKRLALPLLLVLAVTMAVAYWLLLPADFSRAADSALFSLASLANVYFWKFGGSGYFGLDRDTMPLLHLWSLGIEEQFYMGWPLLLALAYRRSRAQLFVIASVIVAAASFAFGELWFATHDSFVYYMLPSRVGELLMGALVAMAVLRGVEKRLSAGALTAMATTGVVLLVVSLIALNERQVFPGLRALIPTVGASCLLLAGQGQGNAVSRMLSWRPATWIGLISYSAYLWHWPLLVFLRYLHVPIGLGVGILVLALTLVLAWATFVLVETPARRTKARPSRVLVAQYLAPAGILAVILVAGRPAPEDKPSSSAGMIPFREVETENVPTFRELAAMRFAPLTREFAPEGTLREVSSERPTLFGVPRRIQPMSEIDTRLAALAPAATAFSYVCMPAVVADADLKAARCNIGAPIGGENGTSARVLLWGDSNASHYVGIVGAIARRAGFPAQNLSVTSCAPVFADPKAYVVPQRLNECRRAADIVQAHLGDFDGIVLAGSWSDYRFQSAAFLADVFATVNALTTAGKFVVILGRAPFIVAFDIDCEAKSRKAGTALACNSPEPQQPGVTEVNRQLREFAAGRPQVAFFDVEPYLCTARQCSAYDGAGHPLYFDTGHLSVPASWKIGEQILKEQGIPTAFSRLKAWLNRKTVSR
jgi:peptidoglycan/LPS O-acetylase OafA/YrhL